MPELPDIELYLHALESRVVGQALREVRPGNPFLLRTVDPPLREVADRVVVAVSRIGKRIVIELQGELQGEVFLVIHLMIAGRFQWKVVGAKLGKPLCTFVFDTGTLVLTEAGSKRRASLHLVRGRAALAAFDRGGLEVLDASPEEFAAALRRENHTLKRTLTDPRLFSGIGNAYSDEILHRARLSPFLQTKHLDEVRTACLYAATRGVLREWTERLRGEVGDGWPVKVTAFRPEMAVHGRYAQPCPVCGSPVQRIVYAENECNYCATCQTGGRVLADRALSRLLGEDWPRNLEELEERGILPRKAAERG